MNYYTWRFSGQPLLSEGPSADPITRKLFSFMTLPWGWHYGNGRPPLPIAIMMAASAIAELKKMGAEKFEVFPEVDGNILVSAYYSDVCIDVTTTKDARYAFVVEKGNLEVAQSERPLNLFELAAKIGAGRWLPGKSLDWFTLSTTVKHYHGSNLPPSKTSTDPAYRWSMNAA